MRPSVKEDEVPVKDMVAEGPQIQSFKGKQGADKVKKAAISV
jgi:hypothetical protein